MSTQGVVVQPGQGPLANYTAGRSIMLKLRCDETDGSIMMFEATVPAGAKSTLHHHHDSDEVAYVLRGEVTFLIGEEQQRSGSNFSSMTETERAEMLRRYGWELLGRSPL
jgi:mannose-6-phosphate isomerase-like protein (cupin superfamily)